MALSEASCQELKVTNYAALSEASYQECKIIFQFFPLWPFRFFTTEPWYSLACVLLGMV